MGYRAPRSGDLFRNPLLAETLRLLSEQGKPGFYEGTVAHAIVDAVRQRGGLLSLDDLKTHANIGSEITDAMSIPVDNILHQYQPSYPPLQLWESPPNSQGIVVLMAVAVLQHLLNTKKVRPFKTNEHNSARYDYNLDRTQG